MQFNVLYRIPIGKGHRTNVVPVDVADVTNMEYYMSMAQPEVADSMLAARDPKGPSNLGTLARAQAMFPDADDIQFA